MRKKVLFTGNGKVLIDDLIDHMPSTYQCFKCYPSEMKFMEALDKYKPQAIVVGLSKETPAMLNMYSVLRDNENYAHLPVIAIGSDLDCDLFYKHVFQTNLKIFVRPVDVDNFMKELEEAIGKSEKAEAELRKQKPSTPAKPTEAARPVKMSPESDAEKVEKEIIRKIELMNQQRGRKMILVVDDDVRMLNVIKMYLQELYDVTAVPSGRLALKYLDKKNADLVLLDYMMPDEDGPSVLRRIREESSHPNIPVIFLTGVSDRDKVLKGLEMRPEGYILKPVKREVLLEKVTEIVLGLN